MAQEATLMTGEQPARLEKVHTASHVSNSGKLPG
jgi:hypothetical protein